MPRKPTPRKAGKEKGAVFAGVPEGYETQASTPKEVPVRFDRLDSTKYLVRRNEYPWSEPAISCFDFTSLLADPEASGTAVILRELIHQSIRNTPSGLVTGARNGPFYLEPMVRYLKVAGFNDASIEFLTEGMKAEPVGADVIAMEEDDSEAYEDAA